MHKQISGKEKLVFYFETRTRANYIYKSPRQALAILYNERTSFIFFLLLLKLLPNIYKGGRGMGIEHESRVLFFLFISFSTCIHKSNKCSQDIYIRAQNCVQKCWHFQHHFKFEFLFICLLSFWSGSSSSQIVTSLQVLCISKCCRIKEPRKELNFVACMISEAERFLVCWCKLF